jgi:hypothetical protein
MGGGALPVYRETTSRRRLSLSLSLSHTHTNHTHKHTHTHTSGTAIYVSSYYSATGVCGLELLVYAALSY